MVDNELKTFLESQGYTNIKHVEGRGICALRRFLFTIGLCYGIDKDGYTGRYCYKFQDALYCILALKNWNGKGDPSGDWVKNKF